MRIGLIQLFALAGARRDAPDRELAAADLSRGHMLATRSFYTTLLDPVLVEHERDWRALLDGLDEVLAGAIMVYESFGKKMNGMCNSRRFFLRVAGDNIKAENRTNG